MCENNGNAGACYEKLCAHCRPPARPNYDPKRGTRRTSDAVKAAVLAAAFGQRVVYLCGNQISAEHANSLARDFVGGALGKICDHRVAMSKERITFYFSNGAVAGMVVFRSIAAQDINLGLRKEQVFTVIEDHWATQVKQEQAEKQARMDDCATIIRLMRKHGFNKLHIPDNEHAVPLWVRK